MLSSLKAHVLRRVLFLTLDIAVATGIAVYFRRLTRSGRYPPIIIDLFYTIA